LLPGHSPDEILKLYPYLEEEDLPQALAYAAWRADEPSSKASAMALLSEQSLADDWNRTDEDEAWFQLQPEH
jgi:hypothetical protein